jgi:hypothetical protein
MKTSGAWLGGYVQFDSNQMWRIFPDQVAEQLGRGIFLN